jgi:hypothetical protein
MKPFLILLTIGVLAFLISSCKDEEEVKNNVKNTAPKTKTQLLTEGHWMIVEGTISPDIIIDIPAIGLIDTISDYFELLASLGQGQDCYKDNQLWFLKDSTVVNDEGPTKCNGTDPQQTPGGTWMFVENETKLEVKGNSNFDLIQAGPMTIQELTDSTLQVSFEGTNIATPGTPTKHNLNLKFSNRK